MTHNKNRKYRFTMFTKLKDIKRIFPQAKNTGKDIISDLLPSYCKVFHIDSHDTENGYRFQGVVINGDPRLDNPQVFNEMPLEVLNKCSNYRLILNEGFIVWTLWFELKGA